MKTEKTKYNLCAIPCRANAGRNYLMHGTLEECRDYAKHCNRAYIIIAFNPDWSIAEVLCQGNELQEVM